MLDILRNYLVGAASPILLDEMIAADKIFQEFSMGESDYEDPYVDILMSIDSMDSGDPVIELQTLTTNLLIGILRQHSVVVVDELPISTLNLLARALLQIQHYDDNSALLNVVFQDERPEELFADLVEVVTGTSAEVVVTWLVTVDICLIRTIREYVVTNQRAQQGTDEIEDKTPFVNAFKKFYAFTKAEPLRILAAIRHGLPVGLPFKTYADATCNNLQELTPHQIANEFIGMSLVSSDGNKHVREVINANIENYLNDNKLIVQVQSIISTSLLEFDRYE